MEKSNKKKVEAQAVQMQKKGKKKQMKMPMWEAIERTQFSSKETNR